ncbi:MAG: hypothetical protein M3P49_01725 [Actinomycetota bacterium]|nr:hypothetical protein [Actinomycetota bacterium]
MSDRQGEGGRGLPKVGPDESMELYIASLVGLPELARELERLGFGDPEVSEEDAAWLRDVVWEAAEKARGS